MWRHMKHPVRRLFTLPLARFAQITHDGNRSGTTQALRRLDGTGQARYTVTAVHEEPDQRSADVRRLRL
jgi:hypothetical protein